MADLHAAFIRSNTAIEVPPLIPEIRLHLATEIVPIWRATEEELAEMGVPPPYWAFAWAGGQALARYVLDHPELVTGRSVLDFASGSGLVAIAAMKAGAASALAADIDPWTGTAIKLNSRLNDVELGFTAENVVGSTIEADVLLAGDVFYDKSFADALIPWFTALAASGKTIIVGDPGRSYCPRQIMPPLATYEVPVTRALEDAEVKKTTVWRFDGSVT